jgi:hypothetical protein
MEMSKRKRLWFILFSVLAVAAIVILASGLSALELDREGEPLPRVPMEEERLETPLPSARLVGQVLQVLLVVAAALLPFSIIYYVVSPEARKRLFRDLIAILSVLLPLYFLSRARSVEIETLSEVQVLQGTPQPLPPAPDVTFTPEPTQWLMLIANVGIALLAAALLVGLGWAVWRRRRRAPTSLDKLAEEAQHAVEAIEAGADLRDTVTRCYVEMMKVLKEERGIRRQQAMTPREFEQRLEELGIPTTQVRRLTRLFEEVRYGDKHLGQKEERQAIVSLTSIVRFCRGAS